MYTYEQLNNMTKDKIKTIAEEMGITKISALKKLDIINLIVEKTEENNKRKKREQPSDVVAVTGVLEVKNDGYGFLRFENFASSNRDVFVSSSLIQKFNLKMGDKIEGDCKVIDEEDKSSPLLFIRRINGDTIDKVFRRRPFERLVPVFPEERINLENDKNDYASRMINIFSPIGKGQRGMIVAPPKAGKTTIIKSVAKAIKKNHPEIELIILLIDERPEEVTDIKKSIDCEIIYSTFDQMPENHCRLSELVLERAERLVEHKKDVVILMDSITRLVRAYNLTEPPTGRTLSGGLDPNALYKPKKFFGAARNIENGGSLTILATALVETGSRMDDVIFEEFKGTGNMELRLDRGLQERRIFPAIDIVKSGTRREEKLITEDEQKVGWTVRRQLARDGNEGYYKLLRIMKNTWNNKEFCECINKNNGY